MPVSALSDSVVPSAIHETARSPTTAVSSEGWVDDGEVQNLIEQSRDAALRGPDTVIVGDDGDISASYAHHESPSRRLSPSAFVDFDFDAFTTSIHQGDLGYDLGDQSGSYMHDPHTLDGALDKNLWSANMDPTLEAATHLPGVIHVPSTPLQTRNMASQAPTAQKEVPGMLPSPEGTHLSGSSVTESRDRRKSSSSTSAHCQCLDTMMQLLEAIGAEEFNVSYVESMKTGLDDVLIYLERGMGTYEVVLECEQCNACGDRGMLVAAIAQQLGNVAEYGAARLTSHHTKQRGSHRELETDEVLDGPVCLGRWKVVTPDLRLQLVHQAVRGHLVHLRQIVCRLKGLVGRQIGAQRLLAETEHRITKYHSGLEVYAENRWAQKGL